MNPEMIAQLHRASKTVALLWIGLRQHGISMPWLLMVCFGMQMAVRCLCIAHMIAHGQIRPWAWAA